MVVTNHFDFKGFYGLNFVIDNRSTAPTLKPGAFWFDTTVDRAVLRRSASTEYFVTYDATGAVSAPMLNFVNGLKAASANFDAINPVTPGSGGSLGTITVGGSVIVSGDMTVNGMTTTSNSTTVTINDKNIELGFIETATGLGATLVAGSAVISLTAGNANGLIAGQLLSKTSGTGAFAAGNVYILSVDSSSQITATAVHTTSGPVVFSIGGMTDVTANGGGITVKGSTDKTLNWSVITGAWASSESVDLASAKTYKINGVDVLTATTLGSAVVSSSLTSVGTLAAGVWQATIISAQFGGTGVNNAGKTITLGGNLATAGAFPLTFNVTGATSITLPTSGTLATLAGAETLSNKTILLTANTSFTALGTATQGTAPITTAFTVITTAATNPSYATLPTPQTGGQYIVKNATANPVSLYPASGVTIDTLGVNNPISLPAGAILEFNAASATQLYSTTNMPVKASFLQGAVSVANGGTGVTTLTGIAKGNGSGVFTAATEADVLAVFGSKAAATVLAAPTGAAGAPSFRQIVVGDIQGLPSQTIWYAADSPAGTPWTIPLATHGITSKDLAYFELTEVVGGLRVKVLADYSVNISTGDVTITFGAAASAGQYHVKMGG